MQKNLVKHGNSLALVIEKPILDLLGVNGETPFEITTDGQALVLTPIRDSNRRKEFQSALEKANQKYAKALKRLA
jgi:antitoxin component of MazEF toxin-antitoxin module